MPNGMRPAVPAAPDRTVAARATDPAVRLVPMGPGDAASYRALYTDPQVMRHLGGVLSTGAADGAFAVACRQLAALPPRAWYWRVHRVDDRGEATAAGLAAVVVDDDADAGCPAGELGVLLAAPAQSTGVATAAIVVVAALVFTHTALQRLWTRHAQGHAAAGALMRTLGFQPAAAPGTERRWQLERAHWMQDPSLGRSRRVGRR